MTLEEFYDLFEAHRKAGFPELELIELDSAPLTEIDYPIKTVTHEYGYTLDLPDGWAEEDGHSGLFLYNRSRTEGDLIVRVQPVQRWTTLRQFAEHVHDNLRNDWWPTASLFSVTSFERGRQGDQEFFSLRYRVRESPKFCTLVVQERIYVADFELNIDPQGFRVRHQFCDGQSRSLRWSSTRILDGFRVVTRPAGYYRQSVDVDGVTVKANDAVDSEALKTAAEIVSVMLNGRDDVDECMASAGAAVAIVPKDEYVTSVPEFKWLTGRSDFTGRPYDGFAIRGLGAVKGQPVSATSEENLLRLPSDPLSFVDVTVHEFAHAIQNLCFLVNDHEKWNGFYDEIRRENLFPSAHAMANTEEFFAVFSTLYFGATDELSFWLAPKDAAREALKREFPDIFAFLQNIYGVVTADLEELVPSLSE